MGVRTGGVREKRESGRRGNKVGRKMCVRVCAVRGVCVCVCVCARACARVRGHSYFFDLDPFDGEAEDAGALPVALYSAITF